MEEKKILFIGTGNMASAIIKGIIQKKIVRCENIMVNNRTPNKMVKLAENYGVEVIYNLKDGIKKADIIVIGVKPQDMEDVLGPISECEKDDALIVSIAAGRTIKSIEKGLKKGRKIARVMPNTMVDVKKGFSALCCSGSVNEDELDYVEGLFKSIGDTLRIKESEFDAFTGYSCSGPAYIYEFIEAMIDAGVYSGLSRMDSAKLTLQNILGACEMVIKLNEHPVILKEKMTSPGGVTIAGLKVLNESGFKGIIQNAVSKAVDRSKEL